MEYIYNILSIRVPAHPAFPDISELSMPAKSRLLKGARMVLARMRAERRPYLTDVGNIRIEVRPGVFYDPVESVFFAERVPKLVGKKSFIEIGTGTGIVSLAVVRNGGELVLATDVNPFAVDNAEVNFSKHRVRKQVLRGEGLEPVPRDIRVGVIFWNHPFHYVAVPTVSTVERSVFDYRYAGLYKVFRDVRKHLLPGGKFLLGTSNLARINSIKKIARKYSYSYKLLTKHSVRFAHRPKTKGIDLRIYSFKPI